MVKLTQKLTYRNRPSHLMKHVLCSNGNWIDESCAVLK